MRNRPSALALALASLVPFSALAQDAGEGMFSFSGYGTLGAVRNSENHADFVPTQGTIGAGYTHMWSTTPDTRLAAQVDARFTDKFSAVLQVLSEYDALGSYEPQVELAHVKYAFTPALQVRAGRFTAPIFMLSEYRKVGYAMPWVRPPVEVYDTAVTIDGGDASYKFNVGDVALSVQVSAGSSDEKTFKLHDARTLALRAEFGSSTLFGSYSTAKLDSITTPLLALYQGPLAPLADTYAIEGDDLEFASFGYAYDPGTWFARGEITRTSGEVNLLPKLTNAYVSAGYRIGQFTPYATLGSVQVDSETSIGARDPIGVINAGLASTNGELKSATVGARWDFRENVALKAEYAHVDVPTGSNGGLVNRQPTFKTGQNYDLLSLSLDFVF
ncbi:hypothetical protein QLQ15_00740 [Lysobacter sp. LF1]|uniref:Porin n=1 Tax=Lysobacter stagni TaxID=3045172 RepID=A0ABT6XBF9_9GAMM|nr:hypothetical protein [Lysobacter sp. LF1]MDI9237437.1 hypothetical protein [Lysobacter sp. LF1]